MYAYRGGAELVEESLKMGADCVGAILHFELARSFGALQRTYICRADRIHIQRDVVLQELKS